MPRPLRIAVSAVSGICCVLVIVLWVRSHYTKDGISNRPIGSSDTRILASERGSLYFATSIAYSRPFGRFAINEPPRHTISSSGFYIGHRFDGMTIAAPHWFFAIAFAIVAMLPWKQYLRSRRHARLAT